MIQQENAIKEFQEENLEEKFEVNINGKTVSISETQLQKLLLEKLSQQFKMPVNFPLGVAT